MPRGLAIPMAYLGLFALLVLIGVALATPISNEVSGFAGRVPSLIQKANKDLSNLQLRYRKFERGRDAVMAACRLVGWGKRGNVPGNKHLARP